MRYLIAATFAVTILGAPWIVHFYPDQIRSITESFTKVANQLAAVVSHNPRTIAGLQSKYNVAANRGIDKVRILIVPGHEPNYGGAEYGSIKERDLVVELANNLQQILANNDRYEVFVTRSSTAWAPAFADYFKNGWQDIIDWQQVYRKESEKLISITPVRSTPKVYHNSAAKDVAYRLYGITKWANENSVDIVIHLHLNDYPRSNASVPGKYEGFAIYIPEQVYLNSTTSKAVAESIFKRLSKYNPISDLKGESEGIVYEQDLIAIGVHNTSDAASVLLEYGYIYEPQFTNPALRSLALKDLAFQTYLGLQDFFDPSNAIRLSQSYDTLILPYRWKSTLTAKGAPVQDVYSMQTAFISEGSYPPPSKDMNDCPRTGTIGPCTTTSINIFQKNHGIVGEGGYAGPQTIDALNRNYGSVKI